MNNLPINQIAQENADKSAIVAVSISFLIAMFPHFFHLPLWVTGFTLFALGWRNLQAYGHIGAVPRWLLIPMVLLGGIGVFAQFWTVVGRDPGLALLTVMTAFKFLESKTHRDILIQIFLCYFILATHFLFGQSIMMALYMLITVIIITTTLITINQRDNSIALTVRVKNATKLIALSIPLMMVLFILVPRIHGPLWGITQDQSGGVTGLSDTMSPGEISDLISSNDVAFRVKFDGEIPPQQNLYWRGPVMANFNGKSWFQTRHNKLNGFLKTTSKNTVSYTITLEPNGKKWLFGLDIPMQTPAASYLSSEYQLIHNKTINNLIRYSLNSNLSYQLGVEESLDYLLLTEQIPEASNPQTVALGQQWSRQFNSPVKIVQQALNMFRNEEFVYTLQPPLLGKHSSDEFLFQTRRGFCEHYASSFALLMRAAGIPARIVTGYQGGELNQVGNYLIIRQSDAHAWTEIWLEDRGWIRIDPTAAVSPDRIEKGLDQALNDNLANFKIGKRNLLLSKLLYNWDNLQHNWNDLILNYDQRKQRRFLSSLGLGIRNAGDMIITLVFCMIVLTGCYWLIAWYRERPAATPDYERIINQLLSKLSRKGYKRVPSEHVYEFLQRIKLQQNFHDSQLDKIFETYSKIKYARGLQKQNIIKHFRQMVTEWKLN